MWSRHEPGETSSEEGSSEVEEVKRKIEPKRWVCNLLFIIPNRSDGRRNIERSGVGGCITGCYA